MASVENRAGFTLIETLAALAITSVIILTTGSLLHQNIFFFDRGTRAVDRDEQLALAVESLTRDFGAARFVLRKGGNKAAFTGTPGGDDAPANVLFITSGSEVVGAKGEQIVSLTIEPGDPVTQLVRRRAAWRGPRMQLEDAQPGDAIILLKGKFDMDFSFSERMADGMLVWHDSWTGETGLPYSVRLRLLDETTGTDLLARAEFLIHADAPSACATGEADCFAIGKANAGQNAATPPAGQ